MDLGQQVFQLTKIKETLKGEVNGVKAKGDLSSGSISTLQQEVAEVTKTTFDPDLDKSRILIEVERMK